MKFQRQLENWFKKSKHLLGRKIIINILWKKKEGLQLKDVFASPEKFNCLMSILVSQNFCAPENYLWTDQNSGSKKALIALLKLLQVRGYYIKNHKLTAMEIKLICENTFGVSTSIGYIDHIHYSESLLDDIPNATAIQQ